MLNLRLLQTKLHNTMISQQDKNNKLSDIDHGNKDFAYNIFKTFGTFKLKRMGSFFNSIKRCGVDVSEILMGLMLMPFYQVSSVASLVKKGFENSLSSYGKDVYYDLKNNEKINWRSLLWLVALRFKKISSSLNSYVEKVKLSAFIADDSLLAKTGEKTEFISHVHDHVSGNFMLGYKLLVLGYWDSDSFYPLDFSLHREKGNKVKKVKKKLARAQKRQAVLKKNLKKVERKYEETNTALKKTRKENRDKKSNSTIHKIVAMENKRDNAKKKVSITRSVLVKAGNEIVILKAELKTTQAKYPDYGLSAKKRENQYSKQRQACTPGAERAVEVDMKKTDNLNAMLKRAVRRGFTADYVLTDSWFCNITLVKTVLALGKKTKLHLITMVKMGITKYKLLANGKYYNAMELLTKYERKSVNARSHNSKYIKIPVEYDGVRVNMFFIKMGRSAKWKLLLTTDLGLNFQKLMNAYQLRWIIEVFFRDCKQFLNLGQSRSTCFDTQIADTTISLVQYTILSFHKRICCSNTFDGIFESVMADIAEYNLAEKLQKIFWLIVETMSEFTGIDVMELTEDIFRDTNAREKLKQLNIFLPKEQLFEHAA